VLVCKALRLIYTTEKTTPDDGRTPGISLIRIILCDLCIFSGFLTLISMGGNTSVLILMAIVLTLVSVMLGDRNKHSVILRLAIGFMLSLELYGLILLEPTTTYTYSTDVYWLKTAISHYGLIWAVILSIVYLLEWYVMKYIMNHNTEDMADNNDKLPPKQKDGKRSVLESIPIYILISAGICMFFMVILLMYPVRFGNILAFAHKVTGIDFDDTFANGRGLIYRISGLACSMLPTAFINEGLLYTIALCTLIIVIYVRLIKGIRKGNARMKAYAYTGIMILTASIYVMMFSFATVIILPFLALAMGIVIARI